MDEINSAEKKNDPSATETVENYSYTPPRNGSKIHGEMKGKGFWVVAIYGNKVVWCNDIEDGFNRSFYKKFGEIIEYYCNQEELEWTLQHILSEIHDGYPSGGYLGPLQPIA